MPEEYPVNDPTEEPRSTRTEGDEKTLRGRLLQIGEAEAAEEVLKLWDKQDELMQKRIAQGRVNLLRRQGFSQVALVKDQDAKVWKVWAPPTSTAPVPSMNKADRLCERVCAVLFSDPPLPQATPASDSDEDRAAAELSTRALIDVGAESGIGDALSAADAFDRASTWGSGFRRYWVDPFGGGQGPRSIVASPQATSQQYPKSDEMGQPLPGPYVTRYVAPDGSLTDDPAMAERVPLPMLKREILTSKQVRFLPATCEDLWQARGVLIAALVPVEDLSNFNLTKEEKLDLTTHRAKHANDLLPAGMKKQDLEGDRLAYVVSAYWKQGGEYPHGCYIVAGGSKTLLHRGTWEHPRLGTALELPLDQFSQILEEGNPYGQGLMTKLGPGNEIRASQVLYLLQHLDRFTNRKVFAPITSTYNAKQAQASTATLIPINPGGKPEVEDIPPFPTASTEMFKMATAEMDDESRLQEVGQGLSPPSVQSGLHAQRIVEQVLVALSRIHQRTQRALIRGWRVQLQLMSAFYNRPQRVRWVGDDGAYKEREWTGADLGSTQDVVLQRGSFTMMSPTAKASVAESLFQYGPEVLSPMELRRIVEGNVGGYLGIADDPHLLRVRRQINRWAEGPPGTNPGAWQQALADILAPLPVDEEQDIARVRHFELARFLCGTRFARQPAPWRAALVAEYERMRQAAGVQTVAEQAQAQQAAAQAEQQAMAQGLQLERDKLATKERMQEKDVGVRSQKAVADIARVVGGNPAPASPARVPALTTQP